MLANQRASLVGRSLRGALGLLTTSAVVLGTGSAHAQQRTFHLDRLMIAGGPEDGVGIWRPVVAQKPTLYGQLALGFTLNALRPETIAPPNVHSDSNTGKAVSTQFTSYLSVGMDIAGRATLGVLLPIGLWVSGDDVSRVVGGMGGIHTGALEDARLELRGVFWRSDDGNSAIGGGIAVYLPTGNGYAFASDGAAHTMVHLAAETRIRTIILTFNTGLHLRPYNAVGGLAVGDEWTFGLGGFYPLREKVRVGAEIFGSTGLESLSMSTGGEYSTVFAGKNTPLEILLEGRYTMGPFWFGGGLGTHLDLGYGAPDLRVLALAGGALTIEDSQANSPHARLRGERFEGTKDTDHDGIPDDVDLCPSEPEDHAPPDPTDGCPKLPDRDGDGIPDLYDKCPDVPEDKDGLADDDGCPEDDYDSDGVPDVSDACPKEPGEYSPDPKKSGCPQYIKRVKGSNEIEILKKIEFDTGKASIKASSFGILDEVVKLLQANQDIRRMHVEGHTDDRGPIALNNRLSQERASSVLQYLVEHGVAKDRLEAHGYGPSKPLGKNDTEEGRQKNRRVEFHITEQVSAREAPTRPGATPAGTGTGGAGLGGARSSPGGAVSPSRSGGDWDKLAPGSEDDHSLREPVEPAPSAPAPAPGSPSAPPAPSPSSLPAENKK